MARGIAHPPVPLTAARTARAGAVELPLVRRRRQQREQATRSPCSADELVPQTLGRIPGVEIAVTGDTAEDVDFTHQMKHGMPYVIAFVLLFAFVLLLLAFRSLVVPLKAIVLNLLSVAAAYGVLVLVFQHRWAEGLLGFKSNGSIISWLPLFLFVVLFGLSMDYHVFILSRVREAVDDGMRNDEAVRYGITVTAGVVTSAALVMVGVFSLFGTLSSLDIKQAGVGLAAAVLIDATIVRAVLLPASMTPARRLELVPAEVAPPASASRARGSTALRLSRIVPGVCCAGRASGAHQGATATPPHSSGATSRTVCVSSQRCPPMSSTTPERSPYSQVFSSSTTRAPASRARANAASTSATRTLITCVTPAPLGAARSPPSSATTTAPSVPTRSWARCASPIRTRSSNPNADSSHATAARTSG